MSPRHGASKVAAAVRDLAAHADPAAISDGLSAPMAATCLRHACTPLTAEALTRASAVVGRPPALAAVVAARGVFAAPLEWVALLATVGAPVMLKVPAEAPAFGRAVAAAFQCHGLSVRTTTDRRLPRLDALVAMGSDETVRSLAAEHPRARKLLHGHRFSVAIVQGQSEELAQDLAMDALLYDGRGCFTPTAVFHLGPERAARRLSERLDEQLPAVSSRLPPGTPSAFLGPQWRRRMGLARAIGATPDRQGPLSVLLPARHFEPAALHGFFPVHPVSGLEELSAVLRSWAPWLAACATDLDSSSVLEALRPERLCPPGMLQRPIIPRRHGGQEMLQPLMLV